MTGGNSKYLAELEVLTVKLINTWFFSQYCVCT